MIGVGPLSSQGFFKEEIKRIGGRGGMQTEQRQGHAGAGVEERRDQEPGDMAASRSWRRPEADSALEPAEEAQPCRLSDFSSVNPMSDSGLWNCKIIDICCFKPLSLY